MAPADSDVSPREHEGWCLPASSDILELRDQQHPTRGNSNSLFVTAGKWSSDKYTSDGAHWPRYGLGMRVVHPGELLIR